MEKLQEKMKNFEVISLSGEILSDYRCYKLNVCALPTPRQFHILDPNPQCDGIWIWGIWEVLRS